jgi:hypothetical protein
MISYQGLFPLLSCQGLKMPGTIEKGKETTNKLNWSYTPVVPYCDRSSVAL